MAEVNKNVLRVNMTFDGDWIKRKSYDYDESPVLIISNFVGKQKDVEVIVFTYNFMCITIPEDKWDEFAQQVDEFVKNWFEEERLWEYVQLDGGKADWQPKVKTKEEKEKKDKTEQVRLILKDVRQSEEESENLGAWREKVRLAESKLTRLMQENRALSDCPPLLEYVEHIKDMALTMMRMGTVDCLWSQKLLVSMDSGFGFSTFLQSISEMLQTCGLANLERAKVEKTKVREYAVEKNQNGDYTSWNNVLNSLRRYAVDLATERPLPKVVSVDLTEWQEELEKPEIQDYLRQMAECSGNYLCVFRVGLFEESRVRELEWIFGNVMSVQSLIAYPPSIESMAEYLSRQVEKKGFTVLPRNWENWDMECDPKQFQEWNSRPALKLLEQWIGEEKRKPYFSGYQSLNLMSERLIYKKAEINVRKGVYDKTITSEDMFELLGTSENMQDPWEELDALIGMQSVKEEIRNMVTQLKAIKNPASRPTLHMCFVGSPGTGKTTMARIVSKIFASEKLLSKGRYIELHARDLCAEHIGGTSIRTKQYCRDAYGSVLFIDEAYSLYSSKGDRDFGKEAVAVLIQQMENHRQDMCVILAGYKEDVKDLLRMNDGFQDRLRMIEFPNYTREELVQIFFKYLDADVIRMGIQYDKEVLQKAVEDFFLSKEKLPESRLKAKEFSNARFVRNLYEQVRGEAVCRKGLDASVTLEIRKEDFENAASQILLVEEQRRVRIGF